MAIVWKNGSLMDESEASVSIFAHALHYGSCFFEGIRMYETEDGQSAVFRLREHYKRLEESCKIYKTEIPYDIDTLIDATLETIKANDLKSCYIRPIVYRGRNTLGVEGRGCPVEVAILVWYWGAYKGEGALDKGLNVQFSSWNRPAQNTFPTFAKAAGNYLNAQLIAMEAADNGFDEGIALNTEGKISEGSGENVFFVKNGIIYTTPISASTLIGITRDSIITIARDLGYTVIEESLPREFAYVCDEAFFSGTAVEISPIVSIDRIKIGDGAPGSVTKQIQTEYFKAVKGELSQYNNWLTYLK